MLRRNHFLFGLLALMHAVFVYAVWINAR